MWKIIFFDQKFYRKNKIGFFFGICPLYGTLEGRSKKYSPLKGPLLKTDCTLKRWPPV